MARVIRTGTGAIGTTAVSNLIIRGFNSLSDGAKLTYMAICSYAFGKKEWVTPSIGRLAKDRGRNPKTIILHLQELKDLLKTERDRGCRNRYIINGLDAFKKEIREYFKVPEHEQVKQEKEQEYCTKEEMREALQSFLKGQMRKKEA